jgi:hypothetical protein
MEWWTVFLRDWGDISGWSLFIGLGLFLVIGFATDRIWSGRRGRRAEEAAERSAEVARVTLEQNTKLIESQGFAEYVFKELLPPKRGAKLPPEGGE